MTVIEDLLVGRFGFEDRGSPVLSGSPMAFTASPVERAEFAGKLSLLTAAL
jgi:hypothetical protein